MEGLLVPTVKPDADNIAKAVLDALNEIVYTDDAQVIHTIIFKRYGEQPCLVIDIDAAGQLPANCTKQDWENHQSTQVDLLV